MPTTFGRRRFLAAGSAALAYPLAARAQPQRRVGVLMGVAAEGEGLASFEAFRQSLQSLGWNESRNLTIDVYWAAGDSEMMRAQANDLVSRRPDVIMVRGSRALMAIQRETSTIPVVFVGLSDPVGLGFVKSMARPGSHITGFTIFEVTLVGKLLELLKQIAPSVKRVLLLYHPDNISAVGYQKSFEVAAQTLEVAPTTVHVGSTAEIDRAIEMFARQAGGGLIAAPDVFLAANGDFLASRAARYRLPGIYPYRAFVPGGGLLFYGVDMPDLFRRVAGYADRILRGENPADLPVQAPIKYEMVINLKTAHDLGLDVPAQLLVRADEVIE